MAVLTPDPIAEGAFGQVYVGKMLNPIDPLLHEDRIIAVKVLRPPLENDPELDEKIVADSVRRFIKENDILRTLHHPGIVRRFGLVKDEKMGWCILLEYIEGETLDVNLRRFPDVRLPLPRAAQVVRQLADAIHYIHGQGV